MNGPQEDRAASAAADKTGCLHGEASALGATRRPVVLPPIGAAKRADRLSHLHLRDNSLALFGLSQAAVLRLGLV